MTRALAAAGCEVTLVLKAPVTTDRMLEPFLETPGVTLRRPYEEQLLADVGPRGLTPEQAVTLLTRLDADSAFDLVVVRGRRLSVLAAHESQLEGRLWTYLADIPQRVTDLVSTAVSELTDIAVASRFLLCPTGHMRDFLESNVPAACGKSVLFPPVTAVPAGVAAPGAPGRPLRLVYAGRFAPRWNTLELTELPEALSERSIPAELHVIGDRMQRESPDWDRRVTKALQETPGVTWHGGQSRAAALRLASDCHVGLAWRSPELAAGLELPVTVPEFGALGLPVVLNHTPMHEELLGADYPLFAGDDTESVVDALTLATDPRVYTWAAQRCAQAAEAFTLERAAERLRGYLGLAFPPAPVGTSAQRPLKVAIAGHDFTFFAGIIEHLSALPGVEVRLDEWESLHSHDQYRSRELASWADVVICEWCGPNALFYARYKRRGQRLLVRLHRFELYAEWPRKLDIEQVDAIICASPRYAELTRERAEWPASKVVVVPNWVDVDQLDRPKLAGASHTLGMLGITPSRKRVDRALDVLEELRRHDQRYTLAIKSKQPWEHWWVWNRPEERAYYERTYRRIQRSQTLTDSVVFDPFGPDTAVWLRRVGFVLSTSDDESFHRAPAEGAASGGVPVVLSWPGAEAIYAPHWLHDTPAEMAAAIHAIVSEGRFDSARRVAQEEIRASYDLRRVRSLWTELIVNATVPEGGAPEQTGTATR
ncbi:glycosyltransferase [Salinactinospora qingdaonensis]